MRVTIVNGFGSTANVGDHALLVSTVDLVRAVLPKASISVVPWQMRCPSMEQTFRRLLRGYSDVELEDAVLPAPHTQMPFFSSSLPTKLSKLVWSMWVHLRCEAAYRVCNGTSLWRVHQPIRHSNLVLLRGCNIVQHSRDLRAMASVRRVTFPVRIAQVLNIPTAVLNVSVGPVTGAFCRRMVKQVVEGAGFVSVREVLAAQYLREFTQCDPKVSCDTAFALPLARTRLPAPDPHLVGLNILSQGEYMAATSGTVEQYARMLARLAEELDLLLFRRPDVRILAVPHEPDHVQALSDSLALGTMRLTLKNAERFEILGNVNSPADVIAAYARCAVVIGMRFHGFVLAALANTPVLGVDVGSQKARGVARGLGMEDYIINICQVGYLADRTMDALRHMDDLRRITSNRAEESRKMVVSSFGECIRSLGLADC